MSRVRFVEHQGKRILIEDFSHLSFGPFNSCNDRSAAMEWLVRQ
ncbi:MAG: hypothetical protein ACOC3W_01525 [Thermodesulfobacteriota bacterium]